MNRPKWVAVLTGAISVAIAVGYLLLVQALNFRSSDSFKPAPVENLR
ncbi:hypothetical protein [Anthocerotibacter panamensis]|nr:hypothetical protein [Anthocerotibacter panamensis]